MANHPATFELPTEDNLTGLLNTYYFNYLFRQVEFPKAKENDEPLSFILFDLDSFYDINQTKGSDCGDAILKGVADCLKTVLPEEAIVARYGGDEFGVLLPGVHVDDAFMLAEKFRQELEKRSFGEGDCAGTKVTASIGVASFPNDASDQVELFRAADTATYRAKNNGRNRVSMAIRDTRMVTKTSHYTPVQLERLSELSKKVKKADATLLREALDDLFKKYDNLLKGRPEK